MKTVKIELPDEDADALERAAMDGGFASSSELVLAAIGDIITVPNAYDPDALARDVAEHKAAKRRGRRLCARRSAGLARGQPIRVSRGPAMIPRRLILRDGALRDLARHERHLGAVRGIAFAEAWSEDPSRLARTSRGARRAVRNRASEASRLPHLRLPQTSNNPR